MSRSATSARRSHLRSYPAVIPYRATFLGGVARVLDIGGTLTPWQRFRDELKSDRDALANDAAVVYQSLRDAFWDLTTGPDQDE